MRIVRDCTLRAISEDHIEVKNIPPALSSERAVVVRE